MWNALNMKICEVMWRWIECTKWWDEFWFRCSKVSATEPRPDWRMQPSAALRHWQLLLRRKSLLQVGRDRNLRRSMFKRSRSGESTLSISSISSCDFGDLALKLLWLLGTSFASTGFHRWELLGYTDLTNNPAGRIYNRIPGIVELWCSAPCHCAKKSPE